MKILNSYVLVKPLPVKEEVSLSGLELTAGERQAMRYHEGIVEGVNDGCAFMKKGSKIAYDHVQGHNLKIDGETYRVITEKDVVLVLD